MTNPSEKVAPPCATDTYVASLALEAMTDPLAAVATTVALIRSGSYRPEQEPYLLSILGPWWGRCTVGSHMMWAAETINTSLDLRVRHSEVALQCLCHHPRIPDEWKAALRKVVFGFSEQADDRVYAYDVSSMLALLSDLQKISKSNKLLGDTGAQHVLYLLEQAYLGGAYSFSDLLKTLETTCPDTALLGADGMRGQYPEFVISARLKPVDYAPWLRE